MPVSDPTVLKVVRPYATEAELLAAEAWTISQKGVLLLGADELEAGTVIRFELALASGSKLIVAEGKVAQWVAASSGRPASLDVRFRRYGASTKAFLDRALGAAPAGPPAPLESAPQREAPSGPGLASASGTSLAAPPAEEPSGVHLRRGSPVVPPSNRDELLAKLRSRPRSG